MSLENKTSVQLSYGLIFCLMICVINGKNSEYEIILDKVNCFTNPDYAYPPNCSLDKSVHPARGLASIQMHREVKSQKYSMNFTISMNKRKRNILSVKNWDACAFFEGRVSTILKTFKSILEDYGTMPKKCPVDKDFHYLFKDLVVDIAKFPPYKMETDFSIVTRNTAGKDFLFAVEIFGGVRRIVIKNEDDVKEMKKWN